MDAEKSIIVEIGIEKLRSAIDKSLENILKGDYGNPVRTMLEASLKDQEGAIRKVVDEIIVSAIQNPEYKERLAAAVINRMVDAALTKPR